MSSTSSPSTSRSSTALIDVPTQIDVRGPRFAAWVTTFVLAAVLVTGSGALLFAQAVVFALGARGANPYALFWKAFLKRTPPIEFEDPRPPRFAQLIGLGFAVVGVLAFALGAGTFALFATAAALSAAFLNAAFGVCLGCELYLRIALTSARRTAHQEQGATT